MREIIIHDWNELQSAIFEDTWEEDIKRYRNNRVFRGAADLRWGLEPSLNRVCAHDLSLEKHMLRSFRKYGYADLTGCGSFWQVVAMAQQYGLPTRLLDWTYSPLVAAHFCTEDVTAFDRDGVIWAVDVDKMNVQLPPKLKALLDAEKTKVFTMEMLDKVGESFEALREISEKPFALFFEPASIVNRIANQYALFSLVSEVSAYIDDLPENDCFLRIVVPKECKLELRDKLDYINISERMIYPGLGGICKWITRRYAALGPKYHRDAQA